MALQWAITGSTQPYTIEAENFHSAVAVTLMLGGGRLGLEPLTKKSSGGMPQFIIKESIDVWLKDTFSMSHHQFMKKVTAQENINDLVRAAESVTLGLPGESKGRKNPPRSHDVKHAANRLWMKMTREFMKNVVTKTKH